jgi:methylglutamate dehydrogenase subunit B
MLIKCPHCGIRPVEEFSFLGDADVVRPQSTDPSTMEQWFDFVYLRENPRGKFNELTQHVSGCRAWLVVSRNTETHEVYGTVTAREYRLKRGRA